MIDREGRFLGQKLKFVTAWSDIHIYFFVGLSWSLNRFLFTYSTLLRTWTQFGFVIFPRTKCQKAELVKATGQIAEITSIRTCGMKFQMFAPGLKVNNRSLNEEL